ncbi:MAG: DUF4382 domain-containing protein [Saprospiraceae bacterium]|nr:DUF4382 domain-containing protein [Saprospiraceae bacterium]
MKKFGLLLTTLMLLALCCSDPIEFLPDLVPVSIQLTSTPSTAEELHIDFRQVRISSEFDLVDEVNNANSGIYDMTDWVGDNLDIGSFEISYDSISWVELTFGNANTIVTPSGALGLPLKEGGSSAIKVPVQKYIQGLDQLDVLIEFDAAASVIETEPGVYVLDPKLSLKN